LKYTVASTGGVKYTVALCDVPAPEVIGDEGWKCAICVEVSIQLMIVTCNY